MDTSIFSNLGPENDHVRESNELFMGKLSPYQSLFVDNSFQNQLQELESCIHNIPQVQNYACSPNNQEDDKVTTTQAKAREYFQNYAFDTLKQLKNSFEVNQLFHIFPQAYKREIMDNIKGGLDDNYHSLTEQISESLSKRDLTALNQNSLKIPKKTKKGKTKIARKALVILKNWLTEHLQDPYPSHEEKLRLSKESGISFQQVQNWFTNARGRIWRRTFNQEKFSVQIQEKLTSSMQEELVTNNPMPVRNEPVPIQAVQPAQAVYILPAHFVNV